MYTVMAQYYCCFLADTSGQLLLNVNFDDTEYQEHLIQDILDLSLLGCTLSQSSGMKFFRSAKPSQAELRHQIQVSLKNGLMKQYVSSSHRVLRTAAISAVGGIQRQPLGIGPIQSEMEA